jgi:hypothetical protein
MGNELQVCEFELLFRNESMARNRWVKNQHSLAKLSPVPSDYGVGVTRATRDKLNLRWVSVKEYMVSLSYLCAGTVLQN